MADTRSSAKTTPPVILASASTARASLLRGAGVEVRIEPARIDEGEIKRSLDADGAPSSEAALILAEMKAQKISALKPDALVIGADQILECNGAWFDKPPDPDHLRAHLMALRGKAHDLQSAVCVVKAGSMIWHTVSKATLTMRPFSDAFLASYLAASGPEELESVGGYRLEGHGAQLFDRIEGDYFTILGLPLLPLLDFLRHHGVVDR